MKQVQRTATKNNIYKLYICFCKRFQQERKKINSRAHCKANDNESNRNDSIETSKRTLTKARNTNEVETDRGDIMQLSTQRYSNRYRIEYIYISKSSERVKRRRRKISRQVDCFMFMLILLEGFT